jgi:hypothetical protein
VPTPVRNYTRVKNSDAFEQIQAIRRAFGDERASVLLGIKVASLSWRNHPVPVVRLAMLLHLVLTRPSQPVTIFDVLTGGRWTPQGKVAISAKTCVKANEFLAPPKA